MTNHIWIYGVIGEAPKGAAEKYYSFKDFRNELNPQATDYTVHIYSPGGDVFEGQAIHNALINTGKPIKVLIEGVCASIATLIAGAADPGKLYINSNAQFMVHPPKFQNISGDSNQLRTGAEQLEQIKTLLISVYRKRTGLSEEKMRAIVDRETWMLPEVAKDLGFVDEVVESMKAVAYSTFNPTAMNEDTVVEKLWNKISTLLGKPKNDLEKPINIVRTTSDGKKVIVPEDTDWVGKPITYEDGSPVPPSELTLDDGTVLVVQEGSTIAEVREAQPEDKTKNEEMEALKKLEAAEARIKELESALEAQSNEATQASALAKSIQAKATTFENGLKEVQAELAKIKNTTAGDDSKPDLGVKKGFQPGGPVVDNPLAEFFKNKVTNVRNTD